MTTLLAGVMLGVAGGAHCVGMCGPLIAAVSPRGWRAMVHHASRSATYLLLGLTAGLTGAGVAALGMGRWVSWIGALCLLTFALLPRALPSAPSPVLRSTMRLVAAARRFSRAHPRTGAAVVGALNGLLPCGLVYVAAMAATGTGTIGTGVLFMAGFAAGTTGILASAGTIWAKVSGPLNLKSTRLAPLAYIAIAALLAWRGWTAGLPHPH